MAQRNMPVTRNSNQSGSGDADRSEERIVGKRGSRPEETSFEVGGICDRQVSLLPA